MRSKSFYLRSGAELWRLKQWTHVSGSDITIAYCPGSECSTFGLQISNRLYFRNCESGHEFN